MDFHLWTGNKDELKKFIGSEDRIAYETRATGSAVFSPICGWLRVPDGCVIIKYSDDELAVVTQSTAEGLGYESNSSGK